MVNSDIQEQIDNFMQKLENSKVPQKASGEAIVSGKPKKIKPAKKTIADKEEGAVGKPVLESKNTSDEAIIAFIEELPADISFVEAEDKVIKKFPLLSTSSHLTKLIIDNVEGLNFEDMPGGKTDSELDAIYSGPIQIPGEGKWVGTSVMIVAQSILQAVEIKCVEGESDSPEFMLTVAGVEILLACPISLGKGEVFSVAPSMPVVMAAVQLIISCRAPKPITVNVKLLFQEPKPEDSSEFLKQVVNLTSVLDETLVGKAPAQPFAVFKDEGEWKAELMTKLSPKEVPLALPPGPEIKMPPVNHILTKPVKIRSPGNNNPAPTPDFIPIPAGVTAVKNFIWTIPSDLPPSTPCKVLVGYGAEGYLMDGTFESASHAPPFKLDKGGVLKVSLITTQPVEVWLELELEVESEVQKFKEFMSPFMPDIVPLVSPQHAKPQQFQQPPWPTALPKVIEKPGDKLAGAIAEITDAQDTLLSQYDKLDNILKEVLGQDIDLSDSVKDAIEKQKKELAPHHEAAGIMDIMDQAEKAITNGVAKSLPEDAVAPDGGFAPGSTVELTGVKKKEKPKGYKPKVTAVNVNGSAIDAKELADALRGHLKGAGFKHYMIDGSDHEFKKTKGVLMHFKVTWAGDPEANLIKWAYTTEGLKKALAIIIYYEIGKPILLVDCLGQLTAGIKTKH